jgi:predicted dinucleotide-binding enzyme
MNVTIIGTGKMARAISTRLLEGGNEVNLIGHTPGKAEALASELKAMDKGGSITAAAFNTLPGEVVILAVPYEATIPALYQYMHQLPGMIVVDITNPIDYQKMQPSTPPASSGAEEIARVIPVNTPVVKAFNTTFAATLMDGKVNGMPLDVFIAGDDAPAKARVSQLIQSGGMNVVDVGPLVMSRQLEAMGLLHTAIQSPHNLGYKSAIKLLS